jgi:polysaccharide export outer membrane protein
MRKLLGNLSGAIILACVPAVLAGQSVPPASPSSVPPSTVQSVPPATAPAESAPAVEVPPAYVIGPGDVLGVVFWRQPELSGDVAVRPDGKISLPLINEVDAAGLTPEALRQKVAEAAKKWVTDPVATVVVRQINSRRVFITGMVAKPGPYPLFQATTVLQLISLAGGVLEFADASNIVIVRNENDRQISLEFNYKDVSKRKNLWQNIELKPGDTVIVP